MWIMDIPNDRERNEVSLSLDDGMKFTDENSKDMRQISVVVLTSKTRNVCKKNTKFK